MNILEAVFTGLSAQEAVTLGGLALIDSTSTGTLVLPLVLLLFTSGGGRGGARAVALRVTLYLAVIALFYWLLGVALLAGVTVAFQPVADFLATRVGAAALVALGAGLTALSWWVDPKEIRKRGGDPDASTRRWIARAERAVRRWPALAALAVVAGLIEVASMLPYLAAIGGLAQSELPRGASALVLVAYCLVMVLPAMVLVMARMVLGERIDRPVAALRNWAVRTAPTTLAWVLGIVGVVIIVRTVPTLLGG